MKAPGELLATVEALGGRVRLVDGQVCMALPVGASAPKLVAELREAREALRDELMRRRLAAVLASRRRCSAASGQGEGDRATLEAGRAWCLAAEGYARGVVDLAALEAAEASVISAWHARGQQPSRIVGEDDDDEAPRPPGFGGIADRVTFRTRPEGEERERDAWFQALWAHPQAPGESDCPTEATRVLVLALEADGATLALMDGGVWCWGSTSALRKHRSALEAELHRLAAWLRRGEVAR